LIAAQLRSIVPAQADTPVPALDPWLSQHGNVAKALVWDFGRGGQPYAAWPEPFKARLRAAFALAWNDKPSGLVDPPPMRRFTRIRIFPRRSCVPAMPLRFM
jgi:hypothetical protein